MPNWSHNRLIVKKQKNEKSEAEFNEFQKQNIIVYDEPEDKELVFSKLIPMPDELKISSPQHTDFEKKQAEKNIKKHGFKDWYDWCVEHWGTKWNPTTLSIKMKDDAMEINYDTAWAPGEGWLNKIAKTYPNLSFEFLCSEESGEFDGTAKTVKGKWEWKINRPAKWLEEWEKENEKK